MTDHSTSDGLTVTETAASLAAGTSLFFGSHHIRRNLAEIKARLDEQEQGHGVRHG